MAEAAPQQEGGRALRLWLDTAAFALIIASLAIWSWEFDQLLIEEVGHFGTVLALFGTWRMASRHDRGILAAPTLYLAMLGVFHFGLTSLLPFEPRLPDHIEDGTWHWLYEPETVRAARLALMGFAACGLGMTLGELFPLRARVRSIPSGPRVDRALGQVGAILVVGGFALWLATMFAAGPSVLFGSYLGMLSVVNTLSLTVAHTAMYIGCPILAGTTWQPGHRYAALAFLAFTLLAFPLGLRGEVLFPAVAALMVAGRRGLRVRLLPFVLAATVALTAAAVVRDVRNVGVAKVDQVERIATSPTTGLMELGGTIRPVVEVIRWYEGGDDFLLGQSYLATIDRPLSRFAPWMERIPGDQDERIMAVRLRERNSGPIGFSPIAEAFLNFSEPGVVVILMLTGLVVVRLEQLPLQPTWNALAGVAFVPVLVQVRNSFIALPANVAVGVLLVLAVAFYFGDRSKAAPALRQA